MDKIEDKYNKEEMPNEDEYLYKETIELMQGFEEKIQDARKMLNKYENVESFHLIETAFKKYKSDMKK